MNTRFKKKPIIKTGWRPIRDGRQYDPLFTEPLHRKRVIIENGTVYQTVDLMKKVAWKHKPETAKLVKLLKGKTTEDTLRNIWDFIYNHIQYVHDDGEELRTPSTTWYERKGDCDCMSIFASSILTNLQIPHFFRITKYNENYYQHVYVVAETGRGGPFIIDAVLSEPNYEKEYSQKHDFKMSLNGIDIAVLDGTEDNRPNRPVSAADIIFAPELEGLEGLGSDQERAKALYSYLIKTRQYINDHPYVIMAYEDPKAFLEMLDYALKYWNSPKRDKALKVLMRNEDQLNISNGFSIDDLSGADDEDYQDGIDQDWQELEGMDNDEIEDYFFELESIQDDMEDEHDRKMASLGKGGTSRRKARRKKRRAKRKKLRSEKKAIKKSGKGKAKRKAMRDWRKKNKRGFFRAVAKGLKEGAKGMIRFNPVTIAARNGFLLAMKLNMFHIAEKLKWGYANEKQAQKIGTDKHRRSKEALAKIEKMFVKRLKGKKSKLKKAILKGKSGGLKGQPDNHFNGLGAAVSSGVTITAAMSLILAAVKTLKNSGLLKKDVSEKQVQEQLTKMVENSPEILQYEDSELYEEAEAPGEYGNYEQSLVPGRSAPDGDKPGFFKKYGLWILGGLGLAAAGTGLWLFTKKKKPVPQLSGAERHNDSSKSRSTTKKKIKKVNLK